MTPRNGARPGDDEWRFSLEEKMDGQHERVNKTLDMLIHKNEILPTHYVSKESLKFQLDNLTDRYEPILTEVIWLRRLIMGGFVGALAQYVYTHSK